MDTTITAIAVIMGALVTGVVTWLVARRTTSGSVDTSQAATLWQEGTQMRVELRDELIKVKAQLSEAITAITELNREIRSSRSETEASREETRLSRAETRLLMTQIDDLHGEVKTYNQLTMGALADNTETRRILLVPKGERTPVEREHLATADERQPEGDHPIINKDELHNEETDGE